MSTENARRSAGRSITSSPSVSEERTRRGIYERGIIQVIGRQAVLPRRAHASSICSCAVLNRPGGRPSSGLAKQLSSLLCEPDQERSIRQYRTALDESNRLAACLVGA